MTINEARTLANINERAKTLFNSGNYWYEPMEDIEDTFYVHKTGDPIWIWLLVTIGDRPNCQCPCFAKWRTCKHLLGVTYAEAENAATEAWIAEREEMLEGAEHPIYGSDQYMHYDWYAY